MKISKSVIISIVIGCVLGSMVTINYINHKIEKEGSEIIARVLVEEKETIIRALGKGVEDEINDIIEQKKDEFAQEIRKNIEQTLHDQKDELSKEMEKAIDEYIKMKIKNLFNP